MNKEDLEKYLSKSGDDGIYTDNLIENSHGFMSWKVSDQGLVLLNVYGDGKYWDEFSIELAKKLNLKKIITATRRSPRAYQKKYGYKLTGFVLEKEV